MFVLIAGGGRTGTTLATLLLEQNHHVRLVETRREILAHLHRDLPTEVIYEGIPTDPAVLEQAGIQKAQVVAACTTSDADNLTICFLARRRYNVLRTIARINSPRNAWLFDDKFHVDVALNTAEIMASMIEEEMSLGDMMTLLKLRRGRYSIIEEKIPPGAPAIGIAIKDLQLPEECIIAAIIRKGKVILPRGTSALEVGDEVLAVVDHEGADKLAALFNPSNHPIQ
ncbi:MAG: potassium transporter TrkA [Chloroflexi bacterium RBG_19FT_COMBO_56_12]|nr:MAG: potassium transporter TrkA [Chloroflexi bacterium RBG_19FT_COMBO_56_12]